jgi:hypothetical protein
MNALSFVRKSLAAVAAAFLVAASTASAAPPSTPVSMQITVTPQTSANGIIPGNPGNSPNAFYDYYNVVTGESLSDSIRSNICLTSLTENDPTYQWSVNVDLGNDAPAGNLTGVTASPNPVTFAKGDTVGTCHNSTILIASDPLADLVASGFDYNKNIKIDVDADHGPNAPAVTLDGLTHVKIRVAREPPPGPSCFATDSEFNYLYACDGTDRRAVGHGWALRHRPPTEEHRGGTNPGQFYYNVIWRNASASSVTVNVNFVRSGRARTARRPSTRACSRPVLGRRPRRLQRGERRNPGGKGDSMSGVRGPAAGRCG